MIDTNPSGLLTLPGLLLCLALPLLTVPLFARPFFNWLFGARTYLLTHDGRRLNERYRWPWWALVILAIILIAWAWGLR